MSGLRADDGRVVPLGDLPEINIGDDWPAEIQIAVESRQVKCQHNRAGDGGDFHNVAADRLGFFQFIIVHRGIRAAEIKSLVEKPADPRARAFGRRKRS